MDDPKVLPTVAVATLGSAGAEAARRRELAAELGLPLLTGPGEGSADLLLVVTEAGLELRDAREPSVRGVTVDARDLVRQQGSGHLSRRQPLARAVGRGRRRVVDATAGLGHDSVLLALLGHEVIAVERSPVVAALLRDGLRRAGEHEPLRAALGGRISVVEGDAREVFGSLGEPPDVVYIDPMFPPKRKASALPRKSIRLVGRLVGPDADAGSLLESARGFARDRVVVNRPTHAPPIGEDPSLTFRGKLVRYDVYLIGRSPGRESGGGGGPQPSPNEPE